MDKKVIYSAVVLDSESRTKLLNDFESLIPEGWEVIAHHMTIVFGSGLPEELKSDLGHSTYIQTEALGISDKAMAVKVSGYHSNNDIPHITIAINPDGGKPVMSNYITDWHKLTKKRELSGIVSEITQ